METGTVKFFNNSANKLFGFIKSDTGGDVFFHFNNGPEGNARMPQKDDRVLYDAEPSMRGMKATRWVFEGQELAEIVPSWNGEVPKLNEILRKNLERFDLEDIIVTGKIKVRNGRTSERTTVELGPMHLSQMCGALWQTIVKKRSDEIDLTTRVFYNGTAIGVVDSDHRFHYSTAPDLRTALGWIMATDLGRMKLLGVSLDSVTKGLETVIRKAPVDGDEKAIFNFYFGSFKTQLEHTIVYKRTSLFSDGYMGSLDMLWRIGTKAIHGRVLSYGNVMVLY